MLNSNRIIRPTLFITYTIYYWSLGIFKYFNIYKPAFRRFREVTQSQTCFRSNSTAFNCSTLFNYTTWEMLLQFIYHSG